jgi:hypothetical protein
LETPPAGLNARQLAMDLYAAIRRLVQALVELELACARDQERESRQPKRERGSL